MDTGGVEIAVVGLGYVGCVAAACLASLGHRVIGIDRDVHKVEQVNRGIAPFFEPGLDELVKEHVAGRLRAATSIAEGLAEADLVFICVGTPTERSGELDLSQLHRVCSEMAPCLERRSKPVVVAIRSTVFPGACERIVLPLFAGNPAVRVVSNPEFLREGAAVQDFLEPSLVVIGGDDPAAVRCVASLYEPLGTAPCLVSLRAAEAIKYACNAFHALKITFANELGTLCSRLGVDGAEVMEILCRDTKLNVSPAYLKPGFAFGGSCLPKDLRALVYRASRLELRLPMLESILPSNDEHLRRAIAAVLDQPAGRLGVYGLAFKEDTDDLRESPTVALIEALIGSGREVRIFDPRIRIEAIYGSNRDFIFSVLPHIGLLVEDDLDELLRWADRIVIVQKPAFPTAQRLRESGLPILDLTRC